MLTCQTNTHSHPLPWVGYFFILARTPDLSPSHSHFTFADDTAGIPKDESPPVEVKIELATRQECKKDMDTASHDTGIDDASDQMSSREGSNNDLGHLDRKSFPVQRYAGKVPTDGAVSGADSICHLWTSCMGICRSYLKWVLLILYNAYLILGVYRTWNKVSAPAIPTDICFCT